MSRVDEAVIIPCSVYGWQRQLAVVRALSPVTSLHTGTPWVHEQEYRIRVRFGCSCKVVVSPIPFRAQLVQVPGEFACASCPFGWTSVLFEYEYEH
eukprot:scaffold339669_cov17-Prasinocladus_malaysianus.AAC.1